MPWISWSRPRSRFAERFLSPGKSGPAFGRAGLPLRQPGVRLRRRRRLRLDAGAVAQRELGARVDDLPPFPGPDHEDHARAVAGADERVLRVRRAVDEVPRPESALFALDQQDAFNGADEGALLVERAVIPAARLSRPKHGNGEAEVRERHVVALEDAGVSAHLVRHPGGLRDTDDEPPVGDRRDAVVELLESRLLDHTHLA